jgi:hypothetical protein
MHIQKFSLEPLMRVFFLSRDFPDVSFERTHSESRLSARPDSMLARSSLQLLFLFGQIGA